MSEDQLKAFLDVVNADSGLQERLKLASDSGDVEAIAKSAGFDLNTEDLLRIDLGYSGSELSSKDLEAIAGGASTIGSCTIEYCPTENNYWDCRNTYHSGEKVC